MIKLITFTDTTEKLLEFNFNEPAFIVAPREPYWITVGATKQTLTLSGNSSFLAYDKEVDRIAASAQDFDFAKFWIQTLYKEDKKILLISSTSDKPLFIFYGTTISIGNIKNSYAEFTVDNKKIYLNNLHWIILTKNTPL